MNYIDHDLYDPWNLLRVVSTNPLKEVCSSRAINSTVTCVFSFNLISVTPFTYCPYDLILCFVGGFILFSM